MTDLQLLFLVLIVLYCWECACWVRRGSLAFRSWLGQRWRVAHPGMMLGNARGAFVFNHLLPPLGSFILSHQFPLSLSPEGLLSFVSPSLNPGWRPTQTGKWLRWEEVRKLQAKGKTLWVGGELLVKAPTPGLTIYLLDALKSLRQLPAGERAAAIHRLLDRALDTAALQQRWRQFRQAARPVQLAGNVLFLYLFIGVPVLIHYLGLSHLWPALIVGLLVGTSTTALLFRRVHARFFPTAEDERFTHFLIVLLSPVSSIRAYDLLTRPALETFHPLTLAKLLCSESQLRSLAQQVLRELHYPGFPLCPNPEAAAQKAEAFWRGVLLSKVEKFLRHHGLRPEELVPAPLPSDASCLAYCPRCQAQFTSMGGVCEDCGGVPLRGFSASGVASTCSAAVSAQRLGRAGAKSDGQE